MITSVGCLLNVTKGRRKRESKNKKQNGLAHLWFLVCITPKQKKKIDSRIKFLAKHV